MPKKTYITSQWLGKKNKESHKCLSNWHRGCCMEEVLERGSTQKYVGLCTNLYHFLAPHPPISPLSAMNDCSFPHSSMCPCLDCNTHSKQKGELVCTRPSVSVVHAAYWCACAYTVNALSMVFHQQVIQLSEGATSDRGHMLSSQSHTFLVESLSHADSQSMAYISHNHHREATEEVLTGFHIENIRKD